MKNFKKKITKLDELKLKMLRIQQGVWHQKARVIIVIEGFDGSGKGGAIRQITEGLDPRGFQVHPIGPPESNEQEIHYLYRFWMRLPNQGIIAVFDRSWYGRVLVERVEKLAPKNRIKEAYEEINQFEKMLIDDGIRLIKIFLKVSKTEQYRRFEKRILDPYKQWKISDSDLKMRSKWKTYSRSVEIMLDKTSTSIAPWFVVTTDLKEKARFEVLNFITEQLKHEVNWMESKASKLKKLDLQKALKRLK